MKMSVSMCSGGEERGWSFQQDLWSLLTESSGGMSWSFSQLCPRATKMRSPGQWRCCLQCLSGSVAEQPALVTEALVASGRGEAGAG